MAYEIPGFSWTLVAGEDLTDSQFCAVDVGTDGSAVLPTEGGRAIGIIQNKPDEGQSATVVTSGVSKVFVGITGLVAGDNVTVDDDGSIIQAAANDRGIGVALKTNAAGELGTVLLLIGAGTVAGS